MTKKEQIYEIAKYVCNACEFGIYGACSKRQTDIKSCSLALGTAKRIYNAGYRKVLLDTENGSCVDCVQYAPWQLVERKIEELKSEIKQLEKENEQLKAKLEARLNCNFVKTAQKQAVQEFADKLKTQFEEKEQHYIYMYDWNGHSAVTDCENEVDELLKEYE